MKKYDLLFIKNTIGLSLMICLPITFLFIIVSLLYDVLDYDLLFSALLPVGCVFTVVCFTVFRIIFERIILKKQVLEYHVVFFDDNARKLAPSSLIFLCDEWVIWAGRLVLHKDFILSISIKPENKFNSMGGYYCLCKCRDNKIHRIFVPSTSEAKRIKQWHKNAGTKT